MRSSLFLRPKAASRSGFTLVEMLVVMAIMVLLAALGSAAFKGGSNGDGTRGAANAAFSMFAQARTAAIMNRSAAAVIVDTNTADPAHCYRRLMVIYLYQTVSGTGTSTWQWVQASPWTLLPGNNYFDPIYSNPFGSLSPGLANAPGPYAYYAFDATGQSYLLPRLLPDGTTTPGSPVTTASTASAQFVVSPGHLNGTTFVERNGNTPTSQNSRYGFYLFPIGRMVFFQDIINDLQKPTVNAWPNS